MSNCGITQDLGISHQVIDTEIIQVARSQLILFSFDKSFFDFLSAWLILPRELNFTILFWENGAISSAVEIFWNMNSQLLGQNVFKFVDWSLQFIVLLI